MALAQLNLEGQTRTEVAVARLQEFEPPEGYYLAFSGGKDSIVIYDLSLKAGIKFDAHYSQGGIDPPELVQFIREHYPSVVFDKPRMSIWQGIMIHGMPRRQSRWCCELIKEHHGGGRRVITGIRWQESSRRKSRCMVEVCQQDKTKIFVHPIIDWSSAEVWEYIKHNSLAYCCLYDEGYKRLGCILCPMSNPKQALQEIERWPKLAGAWRRACYRLYERRKEAGNPCVDRWISAEDMWQWWISRAGEPQLNEAQCIMFEN